MSAPPPGQPPADSSPPEPAFDPYRFGPPSHPIDPAYAPPGYVPPAPLPPTDPAQPAFFPGQTDFNPGGYPPPPSTPYGSPYGSPPPYGGYPTATSEQQGRSNGFAVTGLILGIVSILLCFLNFLDLVLIIPGIVFASLGINRSRRTGTGKGMAIAGLVCSVVAIIAATVILIVVLQHCQRSDIGGSTSLHCDFDNNN
jgi:hypothetical protein